MQSAGSLDDALDEAEDPWLQHLCGLEHEGTGKDGAGTCAGATLPNNT
jgi:hypothetical protein